MHFVVNERDYFDFTIDDSRTSEDTVEVGFDFNLEGYGWGAGGGWYVRRKDIKNMSEGLSKLCTGKQDDFEYSCEQVLEGCPDNEYFHLLITKVSEGKFHSKFKILDDLETVELEADFTLEALKEDAKLWQEYAAKYPVV